MIVSTLFTLSLSVVLNVKPCTIAGCGGCYRNGRIGRVVSSGDYQDCIPCHNPSEQEIAAVDVPPEKGGHRKLMADFDPGRVGGPGRSSGSGTRNA
ncbi:MAG: hypothetical protein KME45_03105 [Stenomitos rutilans HA7619-LM2]|nr:hypothetical protein [Stenomitos rutilans HA7619-LM2]MBW4469373.1 hypothetical protein [Stenomitos rutilans HA7619-LM2]